LGSNRIYRFSIKDNTFKILYNVGISVYAIECLTLHKGHLLAATTSNALGGVIYRSADNGETWTKVNTPSNLRPVQIISNQGRIIAVGENYTAFSDNDGQTWVMSNASIIGPSKIIALNDKDLWLGAKGGGLLFSHQNGASWLSQGGVIGTGYISDLLMADGSLFVAAGDKGVARDGVPFSDGLSSTRIESLGVHKGKIYAGANDKKLWRLENFTVGNNEVGQLEPNLSLFPNPVSLGEPVHVRFEVPSKVPLVRLSNSTGSFSTQMQVSDDGTLSIPTVGLTPGIYALTYHSGSRFFSKRLLMLE